VGAAIAELPGVSEVIAELPPSIARLLRIFLYSLFVQRERKKKKKKREASNTKALTGLDSRSDVSLDRKTPWEGLERRLWKQRMAQEAKGREGKQENTPEKTVQDMLCGQMRLKGVPIARFRPRNTLAMDSIETQVEMGWKLTLPTDSENTLRYPLLPHWSSPAQVLDPK
jgi:hypothetical protein